MQVRRDKTAVLRRVGNRVSARGREGARVRAARERERESGRCWCCCRHAWIARGTPTIKRTHANTLVCIIQGSIGRNGITRYDVRPQTDQSQLAVCTITIRRWDGMGWDGMGWDGMGWDHLPLSSSLQPTTPHHSPPRPGTARHHALPRRHATAPPHHRAHCTATAPPHHLTTSSPLPLPFLYPYTRRTFTTASMKRSSRGRAFVP